MILPSGMLPTPDRLQEERKMWWLLILPVAITLACAFMLHLIDATADKREINRLADESRRGMMRTHIM